MRMSTLSPTVIMTSLIIQFVLSCYVCVKKSSASLFSCFVATNVLATLFPFSPETTMLWFQIVVRPNYANQIG